MNAVNLTQLNHMLQAMYVRVSELISMVEESDDPVFTQEIFEEIRQTMDTLRFVIHRVILYHEVTP